MINNDIYAKYKGRLIFSWVFIFLFFIIYNLLTKVGVIPKVFGGYYTFSIVLSSLFLGEVFFRHIFLSIQSICTSSLSLADVVNVLFLMFLLLFFCSVIFGYFGGANLDIVEPLFGAAIRFYLLYTICIYMPIKSPEFNKICFVSFCVASVFILIFFAVGGNNFIFFEGLEQGLDNELNYQGTALAYVLLTVFGVSYIKNSGIRILCWLISLGLLFLIDSRSEFVLNFVVFLGLEFVLNKRRLMCFIWVVQFALLAVFVCSFLFLIEYDFEINTRMRGLIDISTDESMLARDDLKNLGLNTIQENLIFGDFASCPPGQYIHNIFSSWVDLGFVGFFLLVLIFILCAIDGFFSKLTKERSIVFLLFVSCVLLLMLTKAYFYILLPVVLGLFVGSYSRKFNKY